MDIKKRIEEAKEKTEDAVDKVKEQSEQSKKTIEAFDTAIQDAEIMISYLDDIKTAEDIDLDKAPDAIKDYMRKDSKTILKYSVFAGFLGGPVAVAVAAAKMKSDEISANEEAINKAKLIGAGIAATTGIISTVVPTSLFGAGSVTGAMSLLGGVTVVPYLIPLATASMAAFVIPNVIKNVKIKKFISEKKEKLKILLEKLNSKKQEFSIWVKESIAKISENAKKYMECIKNKSIEYAEKAKNYAKEVSEMINDFVDSAKEKGKEFANEAKEFAVKFENDLKELENKAKDNASEYAEKVSNFAKEKSEEFKKWVEQKAIEIDDIVNVNTNKRIQQYQAIVVKQYQHQKEQDERIKELTVLYNNILEENQKLVKIIDALQQLLVSLECPRSVIEEALAAA